MGTKYCQKQPTFSKLGCWVLISFFLRRHFFSIFVCFVYFVRSFNIFHFCIISFSLLYLVQIYGKSFIQMGKLRGVFLEPSGICSELHHVVIMYIPGERFYLSIF